MIVPSPEQETREKEIREDVKSMRERGRCDASDPSTCRFCEDAEAADRDRRFLLAALDEERKRADKLEAGIAESVAAVDAQMDETFAAEDAALAAWKARASSWQREAERLAGCLNDAMAFIPEEVARDYPLWREALTKFRERKNTG